MVGLVFLLSLLLQDEEALRVHARLYKKVAPAVVGVRSGFQRGSGVIVDREGWILTSLTATGPRAEEVQIYLQGHKRVPGRVVHRDQDLELAIVKIDSAHVPAIVTLGDSRNVKVGQVSYVLGDSFGSIFTDDQVAISTGYISGLYELTTAKPNTYYKGPVIETSAAVNPNSDGGALIDADGRLLGLITLNYHEARFAGVAIPIHRLKGALERTMTGARAAVSFGLELDGVTVKRVAKGGPAEKAGLREGDTLLKINGRTVQTAEEVQTALKACKVGASVQLEIRRGDETKVLTVTPVEKEWY